MSSNEDILAKAEHALTSAPEWATRVSALKHLRERVEAVRTSLSESIVREARKPIALAEGEVSRAIGNIDEAIEFMGTSPDREVDLKNAPGVSGLSAVWRPYPRGVVFGITPYNFPLNLVLHKVLPAICSGAPIILKPDPRTPTPAHLLARCLEGSALCDDFLQVVECDVADADVFCRDPRVEVISFTGSEEVGWNLNVSMPAQTAVLGGLGQTLNLPARGLGGLGQWA